MKISLIAIFVGSCLGFAAQAGTVTIQPGQSYQSGDTTVKCEASQAQFTCEWKYGIYSFKTTGSTEWNAREQLYAECVGQTTINEQDCREGEREAGCYQQ